MALRDKRRYLKEEKRQKKAYINERSIIKPIT
jgi:hypothetical protein